MRARFAALILVAGCGGDRSASPDLGKPFSYPLDGTLRLHHVQAKGTHNSYHVAPARAITAWRYTHRPLDEQLDRQGVRQIELDLNYDPDEGFAVYHVILADEGTTCRKLSECLAAIRGWSDRFPGHLPIYVQLEAKNGFKAQTAETFFKTLEDALRAAFPAPRIITPAEIRGDSPSLREALLARGWPALGALRGRVLFALDETNEVRAAYTHGGKDLEGRLAFVDSSPADPFAAVAVLNDPVPQAQAIRAALAANLLVRTRADSDSVEPVANDRTRAEAALASGAQFISTDYPAPTDIPYWFAIPDGTPARCNPVTAPRECTPTALEDPRYVGSQK